MALTTDYKDEDFLVSMPFLKLLAFSLPVFLQNKYRHTGEASWILNRTCRRMKPFATTEFKCVMQTGTAGNTLTISMVESKYQQGIAALTPAQRVARSAALFAWTRDQIARQIVAEHGDMDSETLRWHVALRLYGSEPSVRHLIERILSDVPG